MRVKRKGDKILMSPYGDGEKIPRVYATEFLSCKLTKVNLKTGEKSVFASGLRKTKGVAVKPDGTVLVVNVGTKELLQIDPKTGNIKPLVHDLPAGLFVPKNFPLPLHSVALPSQKQGISTSQTIPRTRSTKYHPTNNKIRPASPVDVGPLARNVSSKLLRACASSSTMSMG